MQILNACQYLGASLHLLLLSVCTWMTQMFSAATIKATFVSSRTKATLKII